MLGNVLLYSLHLVSEQLEAVSELLKVFSEQLVAVSELLEAVSELLKAVSKLLEAVSVANEHNLLGNFFILVWPGSSDISKFFTCSLYL